MLERALKIQEEYYGKEHPEVAITLTNLGDAYRISGDLKQSLIVLKRALKINEEKYDKKENTYVAETLISLAEATFGLKDIETGNAFCQRACDIYLSLFGAEHEFTKHSNTLFRIKSKGCCIIS